MLCFPATIRCNHVDDGAVLLDTRRGRLFSFNRTASRILQLVEAGFDRTAIIERMVQEFGAEPRTAENDLGEFLNLLEKHQLLESQRPLSPWGA